MMAKLRRLDISDMGAWNDVASSAVVGVDVDVDVVVVVGVVVESAKHSGDRSIIRSAKHTASKKHNHRLAQVR